MDLILPRVSQCLTSTPPGGEVSWVLSYKQYRVVMYRSIQSFNMPPPPAYLGLLTPLPSQGGGNLIIRVSRGWGIWTAPSISRKIFGVASYHGRRGVKAFLWKRLCLCGQLVTRKGLKQAFRRLWSIQILKFSILDSGFECMNVFYCCVYNEIQYLYRRFNTTT